MDKRYRLNDILRIALALCIIYFFNGCTSGFIKGNRIVTLFVYGCIAIWFLLLMGNRDYWRRYFHYQLPIIICELIIGFLILIDREKNSQAFSNDFTVIGYTLILASIFWYFADKQKSAGRKIIVKFWVLDTVIASVYSIYRLQESPLISRYLSRGDAELWLAGLDVKGIVTYPVIYGLVLVISVLTYLAFDNKVSKIKCISLIVLYYSTVLASQFTIGLITATISIILMILIKKQENNKVLWVAIILIAVLVSVNIVPLLKWIISLRVLPTAVEMRIDDIVRALSASSTVNTADLGNRLRLYQQSIDAIFDNYFLGTGLVGHGQVGNHSELLDAIGNYGILYAVLYVSYYLRIIKWLKSQIDEEYLKLYTITFIIYIFLSIVNNTLFAATFLAFSVIIPLTLIELQQTANYSQ